MKSATTSSDSSNLKPSTPTINELPPILGQTTFAIAGLANLIASAVSIGYIYLTLPNDLGFLLGIGCALASTYIALMILYNTSTEPTQTLTHTHDKKRQYKANLFLAITITCLILTFTGGTMSCYESIKLLNDIYPDYSTLIDDAAIAISAIATIGFILYSYIQTREVYKRIQQQQSSDDHSNDLVGIASFCFTALAALTAGAVNILYIYLTMPSQKGFILATLVGIANIYMATVILYNTSMKVDKAEKAANFDVNASENKIANGIFLAITIPCLLLVCGGSYLSATESVEILSTALPEYSSTLHGLGICLGIINVLGFFLYCSKQTYEVSQRVNHSKFFKDTPKENLSSNTTYHNRENSISSIVK